MSNLYLQEHDHAIGEKNSKWAIRLADLLQILGDENEVDQTTQITLRQSATMRRNRDVYITHPTKLEDRIPKNAFPV